MSTKYCPNCNQLFNLKSQKTENIPLLLKCRHSICEKCIKNLVKSEEPIECKICHQGMEVSTNDIKLLAENKLQLYHLFPVNILMLGELSVEALGINAQEKSKDDDCFLNLQTLFEKMETSQGNCSECSNATTKMCQKCNVIICESCFNKSHKNFLVFKNHLLQNIEPKLTVYNCKLHPKKSLDYYCKNCVKSICVDCIILDYKQNCRYHNLISTQILNEQLLGELAEIAPKVEDIFKRLTKTAVDIGHMLYNIENDIEKSDLGQVKSQIEQHFSKLISVIQIQKVQLIRKIQLLKNNEKELLQSAKKELAGSITRAKYVLNAVEKSLILKNLNEVNISVLLEEAKEVLNSPWYLSQNRNSIKVVVNEEISNLVSGFTCLEDTGSSTYKLLTTAELDPTVKVPEPPSALVFPPELTMDVSEPKLEDEIKESQVCSEAASTDRSEDTSNKLMKALSDCTKGSGENTGDDECEPVHEISHYQECQLLEQLSSGGKALGYITHIVTPHNFFVRPIAYVEKAEELIKEYQNAASLPIPSTDDIIEGKIYLVLNGADNQWQRCQIMYIAREDINNPIFHAFCIDFGYHEVVVIEKLRLLPPATTEPQCPLVIRCSLYNCEPLLDSWTREDAIFMKRMTDNKQVMIDIRHIRTTYACILNVECELTTHEDGVSLAHALVFHGRAYLTISGMPRSKSTTATNKPTLVISNSDFQLSKSVDVYITHISSPVDFYVRRCPLQIVYEELCRKLIQYYSLNINQGNIYLPEIGMVCVVNLEEHHVPSADTSETRVTWARAIVTNVTGPDCIRLTLVDCGASVLVNWSKLCRISPEFTEIQALSTKCYLAGVESLEEKWSPDSITMLESYHGQILQLYVNICYSETLRVTLFDKAHVDNATSINTEMIKSNFAATANMSLNNKWDVEPVKYPDLSLRTKYNFWKRAELPNSSDEDFHLEANDKDTSKLEVNILCYKSPSLIYVSFVHQQKTFDDLFQKLQKKYSKRTQIRTNWEIGDLCCTLSKQVIWRRATIYDLEGDKAKVYYLDFACVETVPLTHLRVLTKDFAAIGYAAVKCHLFGVKPADGDEWPSLTKEYLRVTLGTYKKILIKQVGYIKDMSMPVMLWAYHSNEDGIDPKTGQWTSLNKMIIRPGFVVRDKTQQINIIHTDKNERAKENMYSLPKVTGTIKEWLRLEKTHAIKYKSPSVRNEKKKAKTMFSPDWILAQPLETKIFAAIVTHVNDDGIIYLHDTTQEDTLDLIRSAVNFRVRQNASPITVHTSWSIGEPCIAMRYWDKQFHRGRILEVNEGTSQCLVHYIDYGMDGHCHFCDLRKNLTRYEIPIQTNKCVLSDYSQPVENFWDKDLVAYANECIVERICYIKLAGDPIDEIYPIELMCGGLWFYNHLIEYKMEKYFQSLDPNVRVFDDSHSTKALEENQEENGKKLLDECVPFLTYQKNEHANFICKITVLNRIDILDLHIIHSDETVQLQYEQMFEKLQKKAPGMPLLNGIFENKACVAIFGEDGKWCRASILEYDVELNLISLKYVDHGNISQIELVDVREIDKEFIKLPPLTLSATIHDIKINAYITKGALAKVYTETFLDKEPFHAQVIDYQNGIPSVVLRKENGDLVYKELIKDEVLFSPKY